MQTHPTSSSTNEFDNEEHGSNNRTDLRETLEETDQDELILTIDQTRKQEDENNNDNLIQLSCFLSDEQLDNDNLNQSVPSNFQRRLSSSINDEQTPIESNHDDQHLLPTTATLSNDEKTTKR